MISLRQAANVIVFAALTCSVSIVGCGQRPVELSIDDREVMQVAINQVASPSGNYVFCKDSLLPTDSDLTWASAHHKEFAQAISNLRSRNQTRQQLVGFRPTQSAKWVTDEEIDKIFKRGSWKAFYQRFPEANGIVNLSLPAYDGSHGVAVCCVSWVAHTDTALFGIALLKKTGNKWSIAKFLATGVS